MLNNHPTTYNGTLYPSKAEAGYAEHLDSLVKQSKVKWWKRQVRFQVEGDKKYAVVADFLVMKEREEIHEVKRGYYSQEFIYKSQLWLQQYPNFPYLVVEPSGLSWSHTPLEDFIKPYLMTQPGTPQKYTKFEIWLSKIFYKFASLIVK